MPYIHTSAGGSIFANTAAARLSEEACVPAPNQSISDMSQIDQSISEAIVRLKSDYVHAKKLPAFLTEVLPCAGSTQIPISQPILDLMHRFTKANPIYVRSHNQVLAGVRCSVIEADINNYWLSSKKHDSCYQPFYPTWLLSAYALVLGARCLGFGEVVDIGSGDGRIAYCASLIGMKAYGIELDSQLVRLQKEVSSKTGVSFMAIEADATSYDYNQLELSKPMFFISGLPEMGEMLACSVIDRVMSDSAVKSSSGFNLMGSHVMKSLSRDHTVWGWGSVISRFGLVVKGTLTLPTYWTTEESVDTAYIYAVPR